MITECRLWKDILDKICIADWFGYELPMKERYFHIRNAGFDGVMLHWWHSKDASYLAKEQGLFIENMHAPFDDVNALWRADQQGNDYAGLIVSCVDYCAFHEIPTLVLHLSSGDTPPPVSDIGLTRLAEIIERAELTGIYIALENLRLPEYQRYAFDNIDSDHLKFCFDSGHQHCRTPREDYLAQYADQLISLHLHDNDGPAYPYGCLDQHRLPFDGSINWHSLMKNLKDTGYKGPLSLEATIFGHEEMANDPQGFLALAFERAERLQDILT